MNNLPEEWGAFYDEMCNKGRRFIEIDYWSISESTFNSWLTNFESDDEKFLSALLIYRITFRNHEATLSLFRDATDIIIPNFLEDNGLLKINNLQEFYTKLEHYPYSLPFRFATIEGIDNKTGKSGTSLLRDLYRDIGYHKELNVLPDTFNKLHSNVQLIIILDDFLGTGDSFETYADKYIVSNLDKFSFIYIPFTAHEEGLTRIRKAYPDINILPIEILTNNDAFFSKQMFPNFIQNIDMSEIEDVYIKILSRKTKLDISQFYGYGNKSLTHCFDNSVPNNILPIYWYHSESWHRLFTR